MYKNFKYGFHDKSGPSGLSGKALGYSLGGPDSIPGVGGVENFLHSVSRLVLRSHNLL